MRKPVDHRRASDLTWVAVTEGLPRLGDTIWVAGFNQAGKFRIQRGTVTDTRATGVRVWPCTGYWAATHWARRHCGEQLLTVDIDKIESHQGARHATR